MPILVGLNQLLALYPDRGDYQRVFGPQYLYQQPGSSPEQEFFSNEFCKLWVHPVFIYFYTTVYIHSIASDCQHRTQPAGKDFSGWIIILTRCPGWLAKWKINGVDGFGRQGISLVFNCKTYARL